MNWQTQSEDKLDNLPSQERIDRHEWDRYWGDSLPYNRLMRWLESKEGKHVDVVFSDFTALKWLLPMFRTKEQFNRRVEVNTFVKDDKVYYHSNYPRMWRGCDGFAMPVDGSCKIIYVDPRTKLIAVYRPATSESRRKSRQEELNQRVRFLGPYDQLYKEQGIWFHVKAEPIDRRIIYYRPVYGEVLKPDSIILETRMGFMPSFKVTLKKQLNKNELKKYSIKND